MIDEESTVSVRTFENAFAVCVESIGEGGNVSIHHDFCKTRLLYLTEGKRVVVNKAKAKLYFSN